ncbi:polysaccharide biosynthesis tyrosine autokinase [Vulcaniibacterium tengchongense]|uniref:Tyrosine-protein kinase Etk/Wzc n=1 Tax=Vulcaniibacterium tengchongense TaxID=1273429 RepID=A0A3N4VR04_9GAMM|nr:polysaccharide biosynthesis tyrosine autokinase [Vulcaniibacterium tengchongense]RPE81651.1 tyrosine-protein kinase Etk/Wzc [Vulcaniibacterium tengchongense]
MATHLITRTESHVHAATPIARDDDIDLPTMVTTLTDNKRLILFGTALFLLFGAAYLIVATPKYEASAVVQVEARPPTVPGVNNPSNLQGPPADPAAASTEMQLLTSRRVLGEAVQKLGLDVRVEPARFPLFGDFVARQFQGANPGQVSSPWFGLSRYGWGGEKVEVARLEVPDELIDVPMQLVAGQNGHYTLYDANGNELLQGRAGTTAAAGGVIADIRTLRANPGMRFTVTKLNSLVILDALKGDIEVAEQGRSSGIIALRYANADPIRARQVLEQITESYVHQNVARNSAEAAKRLKFVTEQLPNVRRQLAEAQAALREFQTRHQTLDVNVQNEALLNQAVALDTNIRQLRVQQADLGSRYTPAHPAYRAVAQQISQFEREKGALLARLRQLPETQQGLFRLTRDVEVINQTYANLLDQAQQLNIARESAVGNARVIDPAAVRLDSPAWPKPLPVLAGAALLGAMLSVAFVLVRQMFRRGIEDPADVELLGLPVYASIPFSEKGRELALQSGRNFRDGQRLLALRAPTDLAMEALRTLRTSLHFARLKTKNNLLMIAAPSPGVGKTFVCANLAVTIAQTGQRVLLVDADMRRGTLHDAVGVRSEGGLSELIAGQIPLDEAIRRVPGADNLSFISRGATPPNPSELLMHDRFRELLQRLSGEYDIIIIDTPPVLAVTDAIVIGHHVGSCLMVVRWGLNQQREIALAKQRLEQNGVEVKGAIFNGVQKRGAGHYTYSYYEYHSLPAQASR